MPSGATAEAVSEGRFVVECDGRQVREISYVILAACAARLCWRYRSKGLSVMALRSGGALAATRGAERSGRTGPGAAADAWIGDGLEPLARRRPELGRIGFRRTYVSATARAAC
ncbi:hypothetical protein AB0N62_25690 [Streptomyces sp. NPDC093982]|jgi:hypothetical protein|uniref:hypothetical protein n=1 Tax=Streptomyces sp. NPDC093982 TaxID=3155077 RepID=UPI00342AB2FD